MYPNWLSPSYTYLSFSFTLLSVTYFKTRHFLLIMCNYTYTALFLFYLFNMVYKYLRHIEITCEGSSFSNAVVLQDGPNQPNEHHLET